MMMATELAESDMNSCACCGVTSDDDGINLKLCTACKLVRYCGVKCQKEHRRYHKKECKKRMAELRDEILFRQPESNHLGDCPICFLPHKIWTIEKKFSSLSSCCLKEICKGCDYANQKRMSEGKLEITCLFCRQPYPKSFEEANLQRIKRAEANDPIAIREGGSLHYKERNYSGAFDCWTKAAKMGDVQSHYSLSELYKNGLGVEKNKKKYIYHLEEAAIGGVVQARYDLASVEVLKQTDESNKRALKHYIIAANHGHDQSILELRVLYEHFDNLVTKEEFAAALRAHQAAVDAMNSPLREEGERMFDEWKAAGLIPDP